MAEDFLSDRIQKSFIFDILFNEFLNELHIPFIRGSVKRDVLYVVAPRSLACGVQIEAVYREAVFLS